MWVVVYIAPNRKIAAYLKELLEIEGILVKMKDSGFKDKNKDERNVEVMVSEIEIEEANEVISNALQRSN
ncbi:MAG TPA: glutamate decarboxylase [Bacillota bacterium]|nr:glutamate decarboxylase [Bacillota bacterium]